MIRDHLVPMLAERFPGRGLATGSPPDPIAVFPAAHPRVGDVSVTDDGHEATVFIGEITHCHFGPEHFSSPEEATELAIAESVADFVADLFADRIVLWTAADGKGAGFWRRGDDRPGFANDAAPTYVWSGPLDLERTRGWKRYLVPFLRALSRAPRSRPRRGSARR